MLGLTKPSGRLRRGDSPCNKKDQHRKNAFPAGRSRPSDATMLSPQVLGGGGIFRGRSRPSGATMLSRSKEQLGGASADAQSYWQGRFAACALVERVWHTGCPWNSWGVAPNPTRELRPLTPQGGFPLDPFLSPGLSALPKQSFSGGFMPYPSVTFT